jgi:hypothetical protein
MRSSPANVGRMPATSGHTFDRFTVRIAVVVLVMVQRLFGDGGYAIIGPYLAEVWPAGLRASGMGLGYGVGNLGRILGPGVHADRGLDQLRQPEGDRRRHLPGPALLAFWYALAAGAFWILGIDTKGRSIEEIDAGLAKPAPPRCVWHRRSAAVIPPLPERGSAQLACNRTLGTAFGRAHK